MSTTATTRLNDVDIAAVASLATAIIEDPEQASTVWSASVRWGGAFRSEATVRGFPAIASDEPQALGGSDTAPNPVEQVLAALGNCLAVGYAANATAAGIELRDLRIDLDGTLDLHAFFGLREGHAGFDSIVATVHVDSDATREQLDALHAKVTSTSPVGHTLAHPIPVAIELA